VIYISYPVPSFKVSGAFMASLISLILARTHARTAHAHTYVFAFPGSAARTIALFDEHFCPEQPMNLSSDCRSTTITSIPDKRERSIYRKVARYRAGRISKRDCRILHKSVRFALLSRPIDNV
jgi:hypothetical protein